MPEELAAPPVVDSRDVDLVWWCTWLGLLACAVGLIDGWVLTFKRRVAECPDGAYFPQGTSDFTCYVHPQAGLGIGLAALSFALAALVVIASIGARAVMHGRVVE